MGQAEILHQSIIRQWDNY